MVRLTDRPDMTLDVYRGRKTTIQQPVLSREYRLSQYSTKRLSIENSVIRITSNGKWCHC